MKIAAHIAQSRICKEHMTELLEKHWPVGVDFKVCWKHKTLPCLFSFHKSMVLIFLKSTVTVFVIGYAPTLTVQSNVLFDGLYI